MDPKNSFQVILICVLISAASIAVSVHNCDKKIKQLTAVIHSSKKVNDSLCFVIRGYQAQNVINQTQLMRRNLLIGKIRRYVDITHKRPKKFKVFFWGWIEPLFYQKNGKKIDI